MCAVVVPPGTRLVHILNTPKTLLFFHDTGCCRSSTSLSPKSSLSSPCSSSRSPTPHLLPPTISSPPLPSFPTPRLNLSSLRASRPPSPSSTTCGSSSSLLTPRTCPPWHQLPVFWRLVCTSASGHISSLCPHSTCSSSTPSHPKGFSPSCPSRAVGP